MGLFQKFQWFSVASVYSNCVILRWGAGGVVLIVAGLIAIYFFIVKGIKPEFLQLDVFTVYSKYLETKTFTLIKNNQGDEIAFTLYWTGWLMIVYGLRKSLMNKESLAIIILIAGYVLLHGLAAMYFLLCFLFVLPLFFVIKKVK